MAVKQNTEFNYRFQVIGETIWEKIKTLKGFLEGRERAAGLEKVGDLKLQAKEEKLKYLVEEGKTPDYLITELKAEIAEAKTFLPAEDEAFRLNDEEIQMLKRILAEAYEEAEPTRIEGYTDEQMFEANAANEFTTMILKEIASEIVATGHASPAKVKNAMSNPYTFKALVESKLLPTERLKALAEIPFETFVLPMPLSTLPKGSVLPKLCPSKDIIVKNE